MPTRTRRRTVIANHAMPTERIETISIEWADVKRRLVASIERGEHWSQAMGSKLRAMYEDPYTRDEWQGGSGADVLKWIRGGFIAAELQASADQVHAAHRHAPVWSDEEGDPDPGRLIGGFDEFFYSIEERDTKPGLKLTVDMFFAGGVSVEVVKNYGAWVAGVIRSLESQGYDLEIEIVLPVRQLYEGATGRQDVRIRVKNFNELSDFTEWSVAFSPVGTRVVMFTAFGVASEKIGRNQTSYMSMSLEPRERNWGATYDAQTNEVRITANQRAWESGALERMAASLKDGGLIV